MKSHYLTFRKIYIYGPTCAFDRMLQGNSRRMLRRYLALLVDFFDQWMNVIEIIGHMMTTNPMESRHFYTPCNEESGDGIILIEIEIEKMISLMILELR